ncbi:hypothetical protein N8927_07140 [Crocinitomicaceae bacterium]|nr:hypothetical protein [Crocinitomicaceae bacterium]
MKKTLFTLFTIIGLTAFAQQEAPPHGINYQAVVYSDNGNNQPGLNSPGQLLWNEDIGVQFSILSGSASGTVIYKETHATSTDEFGMFDLVIGQGLVQGTQSFNMIDWGSGYHFLKVEVDKTGGTDYVEMSNQQLWSVPYALYSGYSSSSGYADSSAYADIAGNGLTGVSDNGDGTLTFTYYDGSTYTTTVLSGLGGVGPQGPAGADGQDGQDGLSAYEIWLAQGNTGTEQDFLNSLEGLQGPAGTNGVDGADGATGAQGSQGLPGNDGATGPQGPPGTNGIDGQDGQSAYEIWLAQGNIGTEQDFIDGLTGPEGPVGPQGDPGPSNIEMIHGTCSGGFSPTIINGTGFSVSHVNTGTYNVVFDTPFNSTPSILCSNINFNTTYLYQHEWLKVRNVTVNGFTIYTLNGGTTLANAVNFMPFTFLAIKN